MNDRLFHNLNDTQRQAVTHAAGPLLILAGAGSGKTRVLTHRIGYLIDTLHVSPSQILAVTFTNKAADEMRERVVELIGEAGRRVWVLTFHSACQRLLRAEAPALGLSPDFTIYDEDDQLALLKQVLKELEIDERTLSPRGARVAIDQAKNQCKRPVDFYNAACSPHGERVAEVYEQYQKRLMMNHAVDFGDLIRLVVELFETRDEIRQRWVERFHHVLVDEYQDTNHAQYRLIRQLVPAVGNLCVVGDEDQSIYSWRGADIHNILDFERDYPSATILKLERNYRSTQTILSAASELVANNRQRKGKTLWTDSGRGEPIEVNLFLDDREEARHVVETMLRVHRQEGVLFRDMAIFYRTNAQSRPFEDELQRVRIPYVVLGGIRFYERKEIKDLLAYLRVILNGNDDVSWRRMINTPPRGVGGTTLERLMEIQRDEGCSFEQALQIVSRREDTRGTTRRGIRALLDLIQLLREHLPADDPALLVRQLLDHTGYLDYLAGDGAWEGQQRRENVEEFIHALQTFRPESDRGAIREFLDHVALVSQIDKLSHETGVVPMMTLHMAKGLEFAVVFLTGLEEGIFPHSLSMDHPDQIEEERRLCYVGVTRARQRLFLTCARERRSQGRADWRTPSRFLFELPQDLLVGNIRTLLPQQKRLAELSLSTEERQIIYDQPQDNLCFGIGSRVQHPTYGEGLVRSVEGAGQRIKLSIEFSTVGIKKIMPQYVALTVLAP